MPKPHGDKLINRILKEKERKKATETATNLEKVEISRNIQPTLKTSQKELLAPSKDS